MGEFQDRIGRYHLIKKLASGGMAEIYLAKLHGEAGFEKDIAIKKILPQWSSDRDFVSMLIDEAKIAVRLTHPNIAQVYELSRERDVYFIAMEYVAGVDLRRLMQKAHQKNIKVPLDVGLTIVTEALEGLAFAHQKKDSAGRSLKIIHRDISPQNILLSWDGMVKVTDFGIAKAATRTQETAIGVLKGKFAYMSPEQANQKDLDARSDLFAMAVVCYELLAGERLFYRTSDLETLDLVRQGKASFSEAAEALIPTNVIAILKKALSPLADDRYASADDFRKDILKFAREQGVLLGCDVVADFLKKLFEDSLETSSPHPTRTAVLQTVSVAREDLQPTRALETFAENTKTLFLPRETEKEFQKEESRHRPQIFSYRKHWKTVLVVAGVMGILWVGWYQAYRLWTAIWWLLPRNPEETIYHTTELPEPPPQIEIRPQPPEVTLPTPQVAAVQVLPAASETLPKLSETQPESLPAVAVVKMGEIAKAKPVSDVMADAVKGGVGYLSVQAVPWGTVSVDGTGRGRETPVRRIPLKSGLHTVRVSYAPTNAVVSAKVRIDPQREIVCIADFNRGKTLKCGK